MEENKAANYIKIEQRELEGIKASIAINNGGTIEDKDPILMVYTTTKHVFKEYSTKLDDKVGSILYKTKELLDDYNSKLDERRKKDEEQVTNQINALDKKINENIETINSKLSNLFDGYSSLVVQCVNDNLKNINITNDTPKKEIKHEDTNIVYLILMMINMILSFTVLLKIMF